MQETNRGNWQNNYSFIMAAIGSAVGLGNLWRFPYIAYKNGGGAFLIPYFIALLTTGIPLMILEFGVGYIKNGAAPEAFNKIKPKFEWIGWWGVLVGSIIVIYYMAVMAWCVNYLVYSINVKWKNKEGKFFISKVLDRAPKETEILIDKNIKGSIIGTVSKKTLSANKLKINISEKLNNKININILNKNIMATVINQNMKLKNATILLSKDDITFLKNRHIFHPYSQIFNFVKPLVLGLLISWILVFLCIYKGVEHVGKVVKFTVPLPIILLLILLIRGLTLPGAMNGLKYYLKPDFHILSDPKIWLAAYSQIFFSLSIGFGILIAYASYMKPKNAEINNSAFITSFANCATSFFAGFTIFTIIGYLAFVTNKDISSAIAGGPGLAFVVFPSALAKIPVGAAFFSILFFITLLSLGIDSAFSLVEAIVSAIDDRFKNKINRKLLVTIVCVVGFIFGLLFVSRSGLFWLDVVDHWMNNYGLILVGLSECIIVGYFMNITFFRRQINRVSDIKIGRWWETSIKYISPLILIYIIYKNTVVEISKPYEGYPQWMLNVGGWGLSVLLVILSLFLMRSKHKWRYKLQILFIALIISLIVMGKGSFAMFVFGSIFLGVGLLYFINISYKSSKKKY